MKNITNQIIVVADGGSTKSEWIIKTGDETLLIRLQGINPVLQSPGVIKEILKKGFEQYNLVFQANKVFYFGAGCTRGENVSRMERTLKSVFPYAEISVDSDLLAAAKSLFLDEKGIACILGTGSNSGYYDGVSVHKNIPSLGYLLGDEGSGAAIGKRFLKDILYKIAPEYLAREFLESIHIDREKLVPFIYSQRHLNLFLAQAGGFLTGRNSDDYAQMVISICFEEFIDIHVLPYFSIDESAKVGFVGSIAWLNRDILLEILNKRGIMVMKIIRKPIDELMNYYLKE